MPKTTAGGNVEGDEQPQAGGEPETTTSAPEQTTAKQDAALADDEPDEARSGAQDLVGDEDRDRLMRESVALPGQPMVLDRDGQEYGYVGQVPAQPPNEAWTVEGVTSSDEAAKADRAASNPRIFRGSLYSQE